jgi:hypothetical protein
MGAIGLMGSIACLLVLLNAAPSPTSLAEYVSMRCGMARIVAWIFLPSLVVTLIAGLLAIQEEAQRSARALAGQVDGAGSPAPV